MAGSAGGSQNMSVIWAMTAIVFVFLMLRTYTRVAYIAAYGIDDHFYLISFVRVIHY